MSFGWVLAYRGDINSMDFTKMDFQQAIAYRKLVKSGDAPFDYSLTILPFGEDLPIAKVTIFALYDADSNGKPDPGEIIGYHATDTQLPVVLTIDDDVPVEGETDITMLITVPAPSGDALHLYGNADFGSGQIADAYNSDYHTQPAFLVIAQAQSIDELFNTSFMAVKYFGRIPNGLTDGKLDFFADLSGTGLRHGDTAMAFLLWDRDYSGGFPEVSKGDYAGYYLNAADYATEFTLNTGDNHLVTNDTWRFKVNRKVWFEAPFDDVTLSFSVTEGFSGMDYGDQLIVVGAERSGTSITDMSLDTDYVVFMEVFTVTEGEPVFDGSGDLTGVNGGNAARDESGNVRVFKTIPAIPTLMESIVTTDPSGEFLGIDGVYFMAVLDKNRNGLFDNGDYYGYYNSNVFIGSIIPESIDIEKGHTVLDSEIRLMTRQ